MQTFNIEPMVRGYHVYKHIWTAEVGDELPCQVNTANRADHYAVAVRNCCETFSKKNFLHHIAFSL